jgi:mono/diheme cytochrome c family protein
VHPDGYKEEGVMGRVGRGSVVLLVAGLGAALLVLSCARQSAQNAPAAGADPVERGRYLTVAMSCNDCHTPGYFYGVPDIDRRLSGSDLGWVGPWGVVHARNLTPESATGIGTWTTDQIVTALRTGTTPDGTILAPIMPWRNFSGLTDEDAYAIAAYLKSLPPIKHKNLDRIPPGAKATGANILFPPPPTWDVPNGLPAGGSPPAESPH